MHSIHSSTVGEAGLLRCIAFEGSRRIASGELRQVVLSVKRAIEAGAAAPIVIFDERSSQTVDVDVRGSDAEVLRRLAAGAAPLGAALATAAENQPQAGGILAEAPRGPGRPKLGVVGREVTLLPRHWDWLNSQPGGASVALRKLVEQARRDHEGRDRVRAAQEASYRFMSVMAGSQSGFEEAARALFAGDAPRFAALVESWPADVREHLRQLTGAAFGQGENN